MIKLRTSVSQATVPIIQSQQIISYKDSQTMVEVSNLSAPRPDAKTPQKPAGGKRVTQTVAVVPPWF